MDLVDIPVAVGRVPPVQEEKAFARNILRSLSLTIKCWMYISYVLLLE